MGDQNKKTGVILLTDCLVDPAAGGAEKKIFELGKLLDKSKYRVIIASLDCEGESSQAAVASCGCELAIFKVKKIYGISGLREGLRFQQFLKKEKIDILQTYHFSSDIWGTFWGRAAGVKKVISCRRDTGFWRNRWHVLAYRLINNFVDKIVANSNAVKETVLNAEKVTARKLTVIYNGVEVDQRLKTKDQRLKDEIGIVEGDSVLVSVANMKPVKGHDYLLQAMAQVVSQVSNAKLVLIGEDESHGKLELRSRELGIKEKVIFLGKRSDVKKLLGIADICVLSSLSEGMSNAILEYMAAGKPVVATRVGGNPEVVINEKTGMLVEPKDPAAMARAILLLIKDKPLRDRLAESGYQRAGDVFSLNAMVCSFENLFDGLLGNG